MLSKSVIVSLALMCLAGVALSASMSEQRKSRPFELPTRDHCSGCKAFVEKVKAAGKPALWKPKLEELCSHLQPEARINKCKATVDKYIADIETMSAEEFCKEIHLCHEEMVVPVALLNELELVTRDHCSGCKAFVEKAKATGKPEFWRPKLEQLCSHLKPEARINKCKATVDKYIGDIESKSAEEFCKEVHLCHKY